MSAYLFLGDEITRINFIPSVIFLFLEMHIFYKFKSNFLSTDLLPSFRLQNSSYSDSQCHKLTSDVILHIVDLHHAMILGK
jgi:hypothetical protein